MDHSQRHPERSKQRRSCIATWALQITVGIYASRPDREVGFALKRIGMIGGVEPFPTVYVGVRPVPQVHSHLILLIAVEIYPSRLGTHVMFLSKRYALVGSNGLFSDANRITEPLPRA